MKLLGIKSKNEYLIHCKTYLTNFRFNGEHKAEHTYLRNWYRLPEKPILVEKVNAPKRVNEIYRLENPELFPTLEKSYKLVDTIEGYDDDGNVIFHEFFRKISSLYEYEYQMSEPTWDKVKFELEEVGSVDQIPSGEFSHFYKLGRNTEKTNHRSVTYDFYSQLITPAPLLPLEPCILKPKDAYPILREYLLTHIDRSVAKITDYDFCLTVSKYVACESYERKIVNRLGTGRKKTTYKLEKRDKKEYTCYRIAPKSYQTYPILHTFQGKNLEDLKRNFNEYLEYLVLKINEPVRECSHCKGIGYHIEKINEKDKMP